MADFIKGLELNELFYNEVVASILKSDFPNLQYSAALIGWGSEVLGYDDAQSADHNWGVRFQLFLSELDSGKYRKAISDILDERLPPQFRGHPTSFEIVVNADQRGVAGSLRHNIDIETVK